jgi:hypothetical protein
MVSIRFNEYERIEKVIKPSLTTASTHPAPGGPKRIKMLRGQYVPNLASVALTASSTLLLFENAFNVLDCNTVLRQNVSKYRTQN